jgi:hypothetical protein
MKKIACIIIASFVISAFSPALLHAESNMFNPNILASDDQMLNMNEISKRELDVFLKKGSLATYVGPDFSGTNRTASDIIWNAAQTFKINPQFLLVLLQREQSLVEDDSPRQKQLDWAMGYAVCDDCSMNDPRIQKFKGFGNQLHYAAKRIRESYLSDLLTKGRTVSGVGPGIPIQIDNKTIIPANFVTSSLYTYTPHLHGNENFVRIWDKWFTKVFPSGSVLEDRETKDLWLIQFGTKRPITSKTAFYSRFNPQNLVPINTSDLQTYPVGTPISFPNYSLLRKENTSTIYLIVDDTKRGFLSQEAFRSHGFSPDEIVDVTAKELSAYSEGVPITANTKHPSGMLLQSNTTNGVFHVINGRKHPIVSMEVLNANFPSANIVPVDDENLAAYETSDFVKFQDGTLVGTKDAPEVYVIENGLRRHITDEATFLTYGWQWNQIVWTNKNTVLIHELGDPLSSSFTEFESDLEITSR